MKHPMRMTRGATVFARTNIPSLLTGITLMTCTAVLAPSASSAQSGTAPTMSRTPMAPFANADSVRRTTGYLISGPESTTGTCLAAAQLGRQELDRYPYKDTLPLVQRSDTLSAGPQAIGAQCRQPFTVSNIAARDVQNLIALAVQLGDSATAVAAQTRFVAAAQVQPADRDETPVVTKAKRLNETVQTYVARETSDLKFVTTLASVQPLLTQLDVLGPTMKRWQVNAQAATVLAQLENNTRTGRWVPNETIALEMPLWPRADAAAPDERPNGCQMLSLLTQLYDARGFADPHGVTAFSDSLRKASPTVEQAFHQVCFFFQVGPRLTAELNRLNRTGTPADALTGTYWYHATDAVNASNTWPQPGHVSLLFTITNEPPPAQDEAIAAQVRRLLKQYGSQELTITVAVKTLGYWFRGGSNTGPVTPADEAVHDSSYYLGYLHLPVTLAVQSATYGRDSEKRLRQSGPVQFESSYDQDNSVVLVDRTGKFLLISGLDIDETRLTAYITRALAP